MDISLSSGLNLSLLNSAVIYISQSLDFGRSRGGNRYDVTHMGSNVHPDIYKILKTLSEEFSVLTTERNMI